ncbi:MAG TPA: CsbD family protein [Herpetosiphonaceae bacterium]|nr:CsbD family protein [Herpetosiphonaceae bacterium]
MDKGRRQPPDSQGKDDELKGNIKQGIGGATGDQAMQSEGRADELAGRGKGVLGGDIVELEGDPTIGAPTRPHPGEEPWD